jgi:hypothetical protein
MAHLDLGLWGISYIQTRLLRVRYEVLANQHLGDRMVQQKKAQNTSFPTKETKETQPSLYISSSTLW